MSRLQCHSTPDKAPAAMTKIYGTDHGFGWRVGDAIAVQLVSVPMAIPLKIADQAFTTVMLSLGGISLLTLIVLDLAVGVVVIRPVTHLSRMADRVSTGDLNVPEIPVPGSDDRRSGALLQPHVYQSGEGNPHARTGIGITVGS